MTSKIATFLDTHQLARRSDVLRLTGLSKSTLYRLEHQGDFPSSFRLTERCVAYRLSDVYRWMEDKF